MKPSHRFCLLPVLLLLLVARGEETVTYFVNVADGFDARTPYHLLITDVIEGSRAAAAGLRPGDRIVGLDGLRVWSQPEYSLLRHYHGKRRTLSLSIVRDGRRKLVEIKDTKPGRRAGFHTSAQAPDFFMELESHNIAPGVPTITRKPEAPEDDLMEAFGISPQVMRGNAERMMYRFPARGQERILALLRSGNQEARRWIHNFLTVHRYLVQQKFNTAGKFIADNKLKAKAPDPFLGGLLHFYSRIIESPPDADSRDPLAQLGVNPFYFAICYPYPMPVEKPGRPFHFDPEFQEIYDKATLGGGQFSEEVLEKAHSYARSRHRNLTDDYVYKLRATLLNDRRHTRWPFRNRTVYDQKKRRELIRELSARWDTKPEQRVQTAFALLCPAIIEGNQALFRKAYGTLVDTGARERGMANWLTHQTSRSWWGKDKQFMPIVAEFTDAIDLPPFYRWLVTVSPAVRHRLYKGYHYRIGGDVGDLPFWLTRKPHVVAKACSLPVEESQARGLAQQVRTSRSPAERQKTLALLEWDLASHPRERQWLRFLRVAHYLKPSEVFDMVSRIYGSIAATETPCRMHANHLFVEYVYPVEEKAYNNVAAAVAAIDEDDPKLRSKIDAIYDSAGTPSTCLLFASKFRAAGNHEAATYYRRKVTDFFQTMHSVYWYRTGTAWVAFRHFASIPGFEDDAEPYRKRTLGERWPSSYILGAIVDSYKGDIGSARKHLRSSLKSRPKDEDCPTIYKSRFFATSHDARDALLDDLVAEGKMNQGTADSLRKRERPPPNRPPPREKPSSVAVEKADPFSKDTWFILSDGTLGLRKAGSSAMGSLPGAGEALGIPDLKVLSLLPAKEGVWVGTNHGLFSVNRQDLSWTEFAIKNDALGEAVFEIKKEGPGISAVYGKARQKAFYDATKQTWR